MGQVCEARVTSSNVCFEPRFLCARFFVIYFSGYIILFFGGQKYLLNIITYLCDLISFKLFFGIIFC